jgi:hypothetical protein
MGLTALPVEEFAKLVLFLGEGPKMPLQVSFCDVNLGYVPASVQGPHLCLGPRAVPRRLSNMTANGGEGPF